MRAANSFCGLFWPGMASTPEFRSMPFGVHCSSALFREAEERPPARNQGRGDLRAARAFQSRETPWPPPWLPASSRNQAQLSAQSSISF